jgi:hypothetical protein
MALAEIVCVCCAHRGHVAANTLPRILRCRACRVAKLVRRASKTIKATYIDDGSDDDTPTLCRYVDDSYYETPPPRQHQQQAKRKRRVRKRPLTPRMPVEA